MHTVWKGSISFGLVNIPIKLHTATENKDIKLRQLHKKCHTPINYQKVCPDCEEEVQNEDIVKAYEYAKNKFVVLDQEELEQLKKEQEDKAVEIIDFVKLEEIDPIYFEKSYFLAPDSGGGKAYGLLRAALEESGKIGIAKIIIRSKEQLAIVRVYKNGLMMETIHFPDEVRNIEDVPNLPEEQKIVKKELDAALLLVEQLTTTFDPDKYHDEYRTALMELIEEKKTGKKTVTHTDKKQTESNVTDIMSALQASIDKTKKKKPAAKKKTTTKAKKNA
ncbi:DNA repair protein [Alkalihalobacillus alcalophilus ATCC 27647 = CGMCC 1.3604]|uniref:Non-homologous end joining protein Ku n=1 Tax=Alkalihalobacillus alcalophilus ATCC 27647 = CGMCC 1.3604 TaxID=1218173 RepID=A0A094XBV0_ALKAL|nr:Ku protein [Alkalihalobacillus alcalophilus]KGA96240.1 DNA repair protein [Alkalihalobacillus alcalophilus ATCC 27647 = CGMCC 1.3604]MED1560723.1 Ku protein [Alkalihalobacillus alcalophilus]THG90687.1 DNA repair protein [Alkalihalobacillus alcalophilus ATCC 27647 = CGMCC 1.3604]